MKAAISSKTVLAIILTLIVGWTSQTGCSKSSGRQGISGKVSIAGKPLPKGNITFRPLAGTASPSAGAAIVDGQYSIDAAQGVMPGKFRIEITSSRPGKQKVAAPITGELVAVEEQFLPAKYNTQSQLELEVVAGNAKTQKDFELTNE
jgi:hypothetical protein